MTDRSMTDKERHTPAQRKRGARLVLRATADEYLPYFIEQARDAFGPADDDIVRSIADNFQYETGKRPPKDVDPDCDE